MYISNVLENFLIKDTRKSSAFTKTSISGYKTKAVNEQLHNSIIAGNIESACYWSAELISSLKSDNVWKIIMTILTNDINIGNPNLPNYIWTEYNSYLNICKFIDNTRIRNSQIIRNHLAEIVSILCTSIKNTQRVKLPSISVTELNLDKIEKALIGKKHNLIEPLIKDGDAEEIKIAINEFMNYIFTEPGSKLTTLSRFNGCLFWITWTEKWQKYCLNKIGKYGCASRNRNNLDSDTSRNCIWFIWKGMMHLAESSRNDSLQQNIYALHNLYLYNYSPSKKTSKAPILYNAILLLIEKINWNTPIYNKSELITRAIANINLIYSKINSEADKQYKPVEISDYHKKNIKQPNIQLTGGVSKEDLEKIDNRRNYLEMQNQKPKVISKPDKPYIVVENQPVNNNTSHNSNINNVIENLQSCMGGNNMGGVRTIKFNK